MRLHWGYAELKRTIEDLPDFDQILERISKRLPRREVPVVNSANSPVDFTRELNFIVGGNILGRGLTIDNLLVTYYLRRAKTSQMDTVLQHARMFGYRRSIMPYTRVFLPNSLGGRFHFIHVAEQRLRKQLAASGGAGRVVVETMNALRATRLSVLDTGNLAAYEAGEHVYPGAASFASKDVRRVSEVEEALKEAVGGSLQENKYVPVKIDVLIDLLPRLPFDAGEPNMWDPSMLTRLLKRLLQKPNAQGFIYFRPIKRKTRYLSTGVLSGDELREARGKGGPVLCAFRDEGRLIPKEVNGKRYWYPTLVLPEDMPTQLFNVTS